MNITNLSKRLKRNSNLNRPAIILLVFIVAGLITLLITHAASPSTSVEVESGTLAGNASKQNGLGGSGSGYVAFGSSASGPCGARVVNYSYTRFGGPNAAWNVPVCNLAKNARSTDWVERLWDYSSPLTAKGNFITDFGLSDGLGAGGTDSQKSNHYDQPTYDIATANTSLRVWLKTSFPNPVTNIPDGGSVPFNKSWRPADGFDSNMSVIDHTNGTEYIYWNPSWGSSGGIDSNDYATAYDQNSGCYVYFLVGYNQDTGLCTAQALIVKDPDGKTADVRTYEGNFPQSNGGGLQNSGMTITPEEVAAGEIRHATEFAIFNTMFGTPTCAPTLDPNDPSIGTTCGTAFAPAGLFEGAGAANGNDGRTTSSRLPCTLPVECRSLTVPEGMRFAINVTDQQITDWINQRGYTGQKAKTARIFAVAMRDYGLVVSNTSGGATGIWIASGENTDAAAKWRALGIDGNGKDLLNGLFTQQNLYVVDPSYNHCKDGSVSRFYCYAYTTGYTP